MEITDMGSPKERIEKELIYVDDKKQYTKSFFGRCPYTIMHTAVFADSEGFYYEYKYDPKSKGSFAASLTDLPIGSVVKAKFTGEEHYHKGKDGEKQYYTKMTNPKRTDIVKDDIEHETDEPELMF